MARQVGLGRTRQIGYLLALAVVFGGALRIAAADPSAPNPTEPGDPATPEPVPGEPIETAPTVPPAPPANEPIAAPASAAATDDDDEGTVSYGDRFVRSLGSLERQALASALKAKHLELEEHPHGKRVRRIVVHNLDVFVATDGAFLRWFNRFHVTTKPKAIAAESVLTPGMMWSDDLLYETTRKIRDPLFSSLALATAVKTGEPGTVDMLIVTRDIWSLRANSDFRLQGDRWTYLRLSLSENNALGMRKLASVALEMNESDFFVGPVWVDKNVGGSRHYLSVTGGPVFGRESGQREGTYSEVEFSRPMFSLATKWGYAANWSQRDYVARSFVAGELRRFDAPETEEDDDIPWEYRLTRWKLRLAGTRGWGHADGVIQRVQLGYAVSSQRPKFFSPAPDNAAVRQSFIDNVFPRSEFASEVFASYEVFTPRYRTLRNIESFDVGEDIRFGPYVLAEVGLADGVLGSERDYMRGSIAGAWTLALGRDGYVEFSGGGETRVQHGETIDNSVYGDIRLVSPTWGAGRVVSKLGVATLFDETQNRFYEVGGDTGLRGFETGQFTGQRRVRWSTDLRTKPVRVGFLRVGGVAFYDAGSAAQSLGAMRLYQDIGIGMRVLIPQTSAEVLRIDWAVPLEGRNGGFPGRITAGFLQAF